MLETIRSLGLLRITLLLMGIIDTLLAPAPGTPIVLEGWKMISTLVAPAAAPLIAMVILFDVMMSRIRANDSEGAERAKFNKITWIEITVVVFMVLLWLPYFRMIGQ